MKADTVFIKAVAFLLIAILIACLFSEPRCEGFKGEVKVHNLKSFGHDSKAWFASTADTAERVGKKQVKFAKDNPKWFFEDGALNAASLTG